jgi:hypothetical protein
MRPSSLFRVRSIAPQPLFYLGLASAAVYLLSFTLPYWLSRYYLNIRDEIFQFTAREPWRGVLFYVALAALVAFYLAAYRWSMRAGQPGRGAWGVGLWSLVFCLLLIPVQPVTSSDVYGYVFQGRIVAVLGENPFAHLYKEFAADPFYFCVTFHNLPATTGYGPLWIAIEAGLGWLARDHLLLNLLLFKGLAAGLHLCGAWLVYMALGRVAPEKRLSGMLFYAWNPILLYELVGNAHNDAAVAALALLGFFLLSPLRAGSYRAVNDPPDRGKGRADQGLDGKAIPSGAGSRLLAIPCLAAAALVKPVAVLWLPLVAVWLLAQCPAWAGRLRRAVAIAVLALLPAAVAYAFFWAGPATFRGLLMQSNIHGNSLPNLLIQAMGSLWPGAQDQIVQGVKLLTALAFAPFYGWQLWVIWRASFSPHSQARRSQVEGMAEGNAGRGWEKLVCASLDVMLFYLFFVGFQFWPWYLTWLVVPAALLAEPAFSRRHLATIALCILAPLLYFPFGWRWATDHLPAWGLALLTSLPMIGVGLWLGMQNGRRHRLRP